MFGSVRTALVVYFLVYQSSPHSICTLYLHSDYFPRSSNSGSQFTAEAAFSVCPSSNSEVNDYPSYHDSFSKANSPYHSPLPLPHLRSTSSSQPSPSATIFSAQWEGQTSALFFPSNDYTISYQIITNCFYYTIISAQFAMSFGEESRMSQLKDRNIYLQTDQLYEPLRNALRKSSVSQSSVKNDLSNSRVDRNMRSLSPTEAEMIKRSLYIPINKELVPTRNINKVMGKSFTAVDFSQTIKEPLTEEEFSRVRLDATEEIIYEVRNGENENSNIYTSRENVAVQNCNLSTSRFIGQSRVGQVQSNNKKSQIKFITTPTSQPVRPIQANLYTQPVTKPQGFSFTIKPRQISHNNIAIPRQGPININRNHYKNSQYLILQRQNSQSSINKSMTSIKALRNDTKTKQDISSQTVTIKDNKSQLYEFRTKNSDRASNRSRSRDLYKYNLLNGVDQQVNAGCNRLACCSNLQLFSSKASSNPWK